MEELIIHTKKKKQVLDITDEVKALVKEKKTKEGVCNLFLTHTSAALTTADLDEGTDLDMLDARILIPSEDAFKMTRELLRQDGVFAGISSGAVIACALRVAQRMERGNIVCLLADGGWKYLSTGLWTKEYADLEVEVEGRVWW